MPVKAPDFGPPRDLGYHVGVTRVLHQGEPGDWLQELQHAIESKSEYSMIPVTFDHSPAHHTPRVRVPGEGPRVVFVGIPSDFGVSFALALLRGRHNVVGLLGSSRWQRTHPKPDLLLRLGEYTGTPFHTTANVNSAPTLEALRAWRPDLMVMASFDQILKTEALRIPTVGWLNIHPSLLPRHRGAEPIYWALRTGERETGITIHWVVERIDAGPVVAQRRVPIEAHDTSGTLCKRLVDAGLASLAETLAAVSAQRPAGTEPDLQRGSYEPPVPPIELDLDQSAADLDRLIRAGYPDQPPYFVRGGEKLFVTNFRLLPGAPDAPPGIDGTGPDGAVRAQTRDRNIELIWSRHGHVHAGRPLKRPSFP
jgi:methionyl-tRNA formyltransferase